ncbi:MAG: MerR family transcriptional regulator [Alphaproteobacteria bacterium]
MSQKSPEAFRTISEVADELDVPQHVLRFWESKFTSVKPLKRGGGRRYYRPGDVDVLRGVKTLLYSEGYTIRGVQKVFRNQGVRYVADVGQSGVQQLARASAPIAAAAPAVAPSTESVDARATREPAQLSLVEPAPLKLATLERRKLQQRLDALVKLRGEITRALAARDARLSPPPERRLAKA